jgi:hypothetical protein
VLRGGVARRLWLSPPPPPRARRSRRHALPNRTLSPLSILLIFISLILFFRV